MNMAELVVWNLTWVLLPTAIAGILHMLAVRADVVPTLARPIWRTGFGTNKTWRGVIVMAGGASASAALLAWIIQPTLPLAPWLWGAGLGLVYVAAELPNSWIKRRMGIASGAQSARWPWVSAMADKLDSALLGAVVLALFVAPTPTEFGLPANVTASELFFVSLGTNSGVHALLSWVLVGLGIKKSF
jgi:CDP-diacylglycerol--serine O-phosphatidyltransferase